MEHGGITAIGLPKDWLILVDSKVEQTDQVVIGSGIRKSKLLTSGMILASLPNATVVENLGIPRTQGKIQVLK
jgi:prolyl-tRNA editing enzyme YbaK/EbsC (Cys-tRNA(Pro) deacylase)